VFYYGGVEDGVQDWETVPVRMHMGVYFWMKAGAGGKENGWFVGT